MIRYEPPKGAGILIQREIDTARVQLKTIRPIPTKILHNPSEVYSFVKEMVDYDRESLKVIWLDVKMRVLGIENVATGTLNASLVHPREAVKGAMLANSSGVIIIHNHPSGISEPSREDYDITEALRSAFDLMKIDVVDVMVVGKEGYYSFKEEGKLVNPPGGYSMLKENSEACKTAMEAAYSVIQDQCGMGTNEIDIEGVKLKVAPPESVMSVMAEELTYEQRVQAIQESSWAQNEAAGLCGKLFGISPEDTGYADCIVRVSRRLAEGVARKS